MDYEIASVVSLPRNDITTQSLDGGGGGRRGAIAALATARWGWIRLIIPHLIPLPQGGRRFFIYVLRIKDDRILSFLSFHGN